MGAIVADLGDALGRLYRDFVALSVGLAEAAVIALAAILIARWLRQRVLTGLTGARVDPNVATLAANAAMVGIYALAVAIALSLLGGNWSAIVTVLGASTVAVSLALQDVLRGFVAGIYLLMERPFIIGDRIEVKGVEGTVEAIDLRTTTLRTESAGRIYVPNATVFSEVVRNRSVGHAAEVGVTVTGAGGDPTTVPERAVAALAGGDWLAGTPRVQRFSAGPGGADLAMTVPHVRGEDVAAAVAGRLRDAFPEATVAVERAQP